MKTKYSAFALAAFVTVTAIIARSQPAPFGGGFVLADEDKVKFSELDGSKADLDNIADNGVVELPNLIMFGNSEIDIDVDHAKFIILGDAELNDIAFIGNRRHEVEGPTICIQIAGSWEMNGNSRVRANGRRYGGAIEICADSDIVLCDTANMEAEATHHNFGDEEGGLIDLESRHAVELKDSWTYLSVKSPKAGCVNLTSCYDDDYAINVTGDIVASGWGSNGCGGDVDIVARQGGVWIGFNSIGAAGNAMEGEIEIDSAGEVSPFFPPFTVPPASISFGESDEPCVVCVPD